MAEPGRRGLRAVRRRLGRRLRDVPPGRTLRIRRAARILEREFAGRDRARLLDAGSEEGLLGLALARRHPHWTLVAADISTEPLARGRSWAAEEGLRVHHIRCDLQRPLGTERYDAVTAMESLVEIPDDRAAVRSLVAALRPGGLFVAQVPTASWTPVLRGAERTWRREARHGYDAAQFTAVLEDAGLEIDRVDPTFRRTTALAQDVRDRLKHRGRRVQMALLPFMLLAVRLEEAGLTWGSPRAFVVTAHKRSGARPVAPVLGKAVAAGRG